MKAHAFAQGTDIHLASGQEKHLPHEAWHLVQQKQGRVQPTKQLKAFNINDDVGLENEADVMGSKAVLMGSPNSSSPKNPKSVISSPHENSHKNIRQLKEVKTENDNEESTTGRQYYGQALLHKIHLEELANSLEDKTYTQSDEYKVLMELDFPLLLDELKLMGDRIPTDDEYSNTIGNLEGSINNVHRNLQKKLVIEKRDRLASNYRKLRRIQPEFAITNAMKKQMQMAFEKGDTKAISKMGAVFSQVQSTNEALNDGVSKLGKALDLANNYVNLNDLTEIAAQFESVTGEIKAGFDKVQSIHNKIRIAINIIGIFSGNLTETQKAKKGISLMGDVAGAVYGAIPGAGWYGEYIAMSISMSMEHLGTIEKLAHTKESNLNEFGRSKDSGINDPSNYTASKGGSKVFIFMQKVMRAKTAYGIHESDVTSKIADFFEEKNESKFNKGTASKMPVDHGWINDTLDKEKFTEWIFKNRNQVWYMLYGSIDIKKASQPYLGR